MRSEYCQKKKVLTRKRMLWSGESQGITAKEEELKKKNCRSGTSFANKRIQELGENLRTYLRTSKRISFKNC